MKDLFVKSLKKALLIDFRMFLLSCFLLSQSTQLSGQSSSSNNGLKLSPLNFYLEVKKVGQLMDENQFKVAEASLSQLVSLDSTMGNLWDLLAKSKMHLRDYEGAISAYKSAMNLGHYQPGAAEARIARAHFIKGDQKTGFAWLDKCMNAGYVYKSAILRDTAFSNLLNNDQFKTLLDLERTKYKSRVEGWEADILQLVNEIKRVHFLYRNIDLPSGFQNIIKNLTENLDDLTDSQVVVEMQKALATLKDGHTVIYPFGMKEGQLTHHPVVTYWFSDGLFVIDAPKKYEQHIGKKVKRIGGRPADEILQNLKKYVSSDNPSEFKWVAPMYLMFRDYLQASGAYVSDKSLELTLINNTGEEQRIEIDIIRKSLDPEKAPVRLPENKIGTKKAPMSLVRNDEAYWLESYSQHKLLYTQVNNIENSEPESLSAFSSRLKDSLAVSNSRYLVLDLRYNSGGNASFLPSLLKTIVWFETERQGTVFVLMGRNTFSAAQTLLNRLERFTDATFLGEPSGSRPNRFGNEMQFKLNYSGVLGSISSGFNQGWTSRDQRIWISPEIPVSLSSSEYFSGIDPAMEVIFEIVNKSKG